jgi:hypothetical protein
VPGLSVHAEQGRSADAWIEPTPLVGGLVDTRDEAPPMRHGGATHGRGHSTSLPGCCADSEGPRRTLHGSPHADCSAVCGSFTPSWCPNLWCTRIAESVASANNGSSVRAATLTCPRSDAHTMHVSGSTGPRRGSLSQRSTSLNAASLWRGRWNTGTGKREAER